MQSRRDSREVGSALRVGTSRWFGVKCCGWWSKSAPPMVGDLNKPYVIFGYFFVSVQRTDQRFLTFLMLGLTDHYISRVVLGGWPEFAKIPNWKVTEIRKIDPPFQFSIPPSKRNVTQELTSVFSYAELQSQSLVHTLPSLVPNY